MGSTIHLLRPLPDEPCSSPSVASRGRAAARRTRISVSTATSASVTGVLSGFVLTWRSPARNRAIEMASAASASSCARTRSGPMWAPTISHRSLLCALADDPELRPCHLHHLRLRPGHCLGGAGQQVVDTAHPVEPRAGLERQE